MAHNFFSHQRTITMYIHTNIYTFFMLTRLKFFGYKLKKNEYLKKSLKPNMWFFCLFVYLCWQISSSKLFFLWHILKLQNYWINQLFLIFKTQNISILKEDIKGKIQLGETLFKILLISSVGWAFIEVVIDTPGNFLK